MRAGQIVNQAAGYKAFLPAPLPPDPPVAMDHELSTLLSDADRALGRLTSVLPNPELFVAMYVRHEAVLSSQIEGTQSSLDDVLQFEVDEKGHHPRDVEEFESAGILREITAWQRNRRYEFEPYLVLFRAPRAAGE